MLRSASPNTSYLLTLISAKFSKARDFLQTKLLLVLKLLEPPQKFLLGKDFKCGVLWYTRIYCVEAQTWVFQQRFTVKYVERGAEIQRRRGQLVSSNNRYFSSMRSIFGPKIWDINFFYVHHNVILIKVYCAWVCLLFDKKLRFNGTMRGKCNILMEIFISWSENRGVLTMNLQGERGFIRETKNDWKCGWREEEIEEIWWGMAAIR